MTCSWCTGPMPRSSRADARFCCDKCRLYAWRQRRRYDTKAKRAARRGRITGQDLRHSRLVQLRTYEARIADGAGTDWMRDKVEALRAELI